MKQYFFPLLVYLLVFTFGCKNDNNNDDDNITETSQWTMIVNVDITEPEPSPFTIAGVVNVTINGNSITFSGDYQIGNQNFPEVVVHGTISNDRIVTVTTTSYEASFEAGGTTYTESLSWNFEPFLFTGNTATGTATLTAVQNPGNYVESGTMTFTATKKD